MNGAWLAGIFFVALGVWLLRRFIAICEVANQAEWGSAWLNWLDGLNRLFCCRFHGLPTEILPIPERGPVLIASNHVSGLDPLLLIAASRRPLRFIIAQEQYDRWYLRWLFRAVGCIPITREHDPRRALYLARQALARGEVVALFPQGQIRPDHQPPKPLKRGIVLLSKMSGAPVVPVRINGVRGQGFTVRAVFMRSRARIEKRPLLRCRDHTAESCLEQLSEALHTKQVAS
ncbi:MAG: 1-acyl-sn-glycerol-3-phosphate acyltransferase [Gammaproteobacteria bacterium]|nr:1-acyl-sn-glycerol-3-phosphate acyltransferase [Gammaproteobacteria bacterium]